MDGLGIDIGGTSVKLAAVGRDGAVLWTARSSRYSRPDAEGLAAAIREAAGGRIDAGAIPSAAVGLCVPGLMNEDGTAVRQSVNVPGLNGVRLDELVARAVGARPATVSVATDAYATAFDLYQTLRPQGRLFLLAIGTGVGAAVLDEGRPLHVDGESPGHFGQMDVSIEGHPVIGPDGGAGSLEGYISSAALAARYGPANAWLSRMRADDPPLRALARAIRIAHALYRPHHVILAGGIGIRLAPFVDDLNGIVTHQLTAIRRPDATLSVAHSDFHAAQGAARLALQTRRPAPEPTH
jgi:predicted NBD/HSP70 family sugar kinase